MNDVVAFYESSESDIERDDPHIVSPSDRDDVGVGHLPVTHQTVVRYQCTLHEGHVVDEEPMSWVTA